MNRQDMITYRRKKYPVTAVFSERLKDLYAVAGESLLHELTNTGRRSYQGFRSRRASDIDERCIDYYVPDKILNEPEESIAGYIHENIDSEF